MAIDLHVSRSIDLEIDEPVSCDLLEHVGQEGQGSLNVAKARSIQIELDDDVRFSGLALDPGFARVHLNSSTFQTPRSCTNSTVPPAP